MPKSGRFVKFDEPARRAPVPPVGGGFLQVLRETALRTGHDPGSELYNEALGLAERGEYEAAKDRLYVLLGLSPTDGQARLLLAKIYVAEEEWGRAEFALDEATECGALPPDDLRTEVHKHVLEEAVHGHETAEGHDVAVAMVTSAEQSEALRSELGSVREALHASEREAQFWMWLALAVVLMFFLSGMWRLASERPGQIAEVLPPIDPVGTWGTLPTSPVDLARPLPDSPVLSPSDTVASLVAESPADVVAVVNGGDVTLRGTVTNEGQLEALTRRIMAVAGIDAIDAAAVSTVGAVPSTAAAVSAPAVGGPTKHVVRPGDTYQRLSLRYYGTTARWRTIQRANGGLAPEALRVGQTLTVPAP